MDCQRNYGIPEYPACSNHGNCINGQCVCHAGWSSFGDFEVMNGFDCDIHILSIKIIGGLNFIIGILTLLYIIYYLIHRHKKIYELKDLFPIIFMFLSLAISLQGLYKLINPEKNIMGNTNVLSILSCINSIIITSSIIISSAIFIEISIKFLFGYSIIMSNESKKSILMKFSIIKRINWPTACFHAIAASIPVIFAPIFPQFSDKFAIFYSFEIFFFTVSFTFIICYLVNTIIIELKIYFNNKIYIENQILINNINYLNNLNNLKLLYNKLLIIYYSILISGFSVFLPNIPFAFWSYLRRKYIYMAQIECLLSLPFIWCIMYFLPKINYKFLNIYNINIQQILMNYLPNNNNNNNNNENTLKNNANNENNANNFVNLKDNFNMNLINSNEFNEESSIEIQKNTYLYNMNKFKNDNNININNNHNNNDNNINNNHNNNNHNNNNISYSSIMNNNNSGKVVPLMENDN